MLFENTAGNNGNEVDHDKNTCGYNEGPHKFWMNGEKRQQINFLLKPGEAASPDCLYVRLGGKYSDKSYVSMDTNLSEGIMVVFFNTQGGRDTVTYRPVLEKTIKINLFNLFFHSGHLLHLCWRQRCAIIIKQGLDGGVFTDLNHLHAGTRHCQGLL